MLSHTDICDRYSTLIAVFLFTMSIHLWSVISGEFDFTKFLDETLNEWWEASGQDRDSFYTVTFEKFRSLEFGILLFRFTWSYTSWHKACYPRDLREVYKRLSVVTLLKQTALVCTHIWNTFNCWRILLVQEVPHFRWHGPLKNGSVAAWVPTVVKMQTLFTLRVNTIHRKFNNVYVTTW